MQKNPNYPSFTSFLNSDTDDIILYDNPSQQLLTSPFYERILNLIQKNPTDKSELIQTVAEEMIHYFLDLLEKENYSKDYFSFTDKERRNIKKIENALRENIYGNFPKIEPLSELIDVSPSKLKNSFKNIHQKTLYQFYSDLQMEAAKEELLKGRSIGDTAHLFNYANISKFSTRFKDYFGELPSKFIKNPSHP